MCRPPQPDFQSRRRQYPARAIESSGHVSSPGRTGVGVSTIATTIPLSGPWSTQSPRSQHCLRLLHSVREITSRQPQRPHAVHVAVSTSSTNKASFKCVTFCGFGRMIWVSESRSATCRRVIRAASSSLEIRSASLENRGTRTGKKRHVTSSFSGKSIREADYAFDHLYLGVSFSFVRKPSPDRWRSPCFPNYPSRELS